MKEAQSQSPSTSPLRKTLFAILYVAALLVFIELFYRLIWDEPPRTYITFGNHPIFHHVPRALENGGLENHDMRGAPYKIEKAPGTLRIVFLGDSFTYGLTPPDQTIPKYLEKLLDRRLPNVPVEILNFGNISYSPVLYQIVYDQLVKRLKPDYVIILYDTFDPIDDYIYYNIAEKDENGVPTAMIGDEYYKTGIRRLAVVRYLLFLADVLKNKLHYVAAVGHYENRSQFVIDPNAFPHVLEVSFKLMDHLTAQIRADGSQLLLFQYPWPYQLHRVGDLPGWCKEWQVDPRTWKTPDENAFAGLVLKFCAEHGLKCWDFFPEIRKLEDSIGEDSRTLLYDPAQGHFTAYTDSIFARFIYDKLRETGFPPGGPAASPLLPAPDTPSPPTP